MIEGLQGLLAVGTALDVAGDARELRPGETADDEPFELGPIGAARRVHGSTPRHGSGHHLSNAACYTSLPLLRRGSRSSLSVRRRRLDHRRHLRVVGLMNSDDEPSSSDGEGRNLHRDLPEPARARQGGRRARRGTGWSISMRRSSTAGAGAGTCRSRRSPTSSRTSSRRWRRTSRASARSEQGDTFRGWLRTITRNKVRDHFRRWGREPGGAGGTEAQIRLARAPRGRAPARTTRETRTRARCLFRTALELDPRRVRGPHLAGVLADRGRGPVRPRRSRST